MSFYTTFKHIFKKQHKTRKSYNLEIGKTSVKALTTKTKLFDVFQVSSSCSSVYVDGSEIRGSSNASVLVKYGTYTGLARFTVWMPEFPLEVSVTDTRLNQIKGWKVPEEHHVLSKNKRSLNDTNPADKKTPQPPPSGDIMDKEEGDDLDYEEEDIEEEDVDEDEDEEEDGDELTEGKMRFRSGDKWDEINSIDRGSSSGSAGAGAGSNNCRLRFQQSPVEVYPPPLLFIPLI